MSTMRWYLNLHEDGAWAWWWFVVRSGCWRGHDMQTHEHCEESYVLERWRECSRCGAWGGWVP